MSTTSSTRPRPGTADVLGPASVTGLDATLAPDPLRLVGPAACRALLGTVARRG